MKTRMYAAPAVKGLSLVSGIQNDAFMHREGLKG